MYLNNVIDPMYPSLRSDQKELLNNYLIKLIDIIEIKFKLTSQSSEFRQQLERNDWRDAKSLLNILLPFVDTKADKSEIKDINDIYVQMEEPVDMNLEEPSFKYSNIQYGRCNRTGGQATITKYDVSHLEQNFHMLLMTVQQIAHKLYVNWRNVRPLPVYLGVNLNVADDELNFLDLLIHETNQAISSQELKEWNTYDDIQNYGGLFIGDIYDTYANNIFDEIKNIKWLIYEIERVPYYKILNTTMSVDNPLNGITWGFLSDSQRKLFTSEVSNLKTIFKNNKKLKVVVATLTFFFNKYYSGINQAMGQDGYKAFKFNKDEDDPDDDTRKNIFDFIDQDDFILSVETIPPKHLYRFLIECFNQLKLSWYSRFTIIQDNGVYKFMPKETDITFSGGYIRIKNIYNFAKNLTHYQSGNDYLMYPKYWRALTKEQKEIITDRINFLKEDWFNISGYIRRTYGENFDVSDPDLVAKVNGMILDEFKDFIVAFTVDCMAYKGILSSFTPDPYDNVNLESVLKHNNLNECYYFLTNKLYKDSMISVNDNGVERRVNYLDFMGNNGAANSWWTSLYALDWVSQISFFHRYINGRVMMVTGGTGVGKSSQVPKLLLYALKMYDRKSDGRIICTQPRIAPTTSVSAQVAEQMGVPIIEYNESVKENIRTSNYQLQFKYQEDDHALSTNELMLRMVTDGTLVEELKSSPLLRRVRKEGDTFIPTDNNKYDIVIVDEAHEHNKNMDIILTLMRTTMQMNNTLRLVIISATMDDDEPTYRRYYRDINDNQLYPPTTWLSNHNLDRVNVDRRLDISKPGETTIFTITDIYKPGKHAEDIIVDEIISGGGSGDILLFRPGQREIGKSIDILNKRLADRSSILVVPFFSQMDNQLKDLVESIEDSVKYNITIPKTYDLMSGYEPDKMDSVPKGTYKQIIIVATNIAEASITIPTLKFVVDTGIQKTMIYDPISGAPTLLEKEITESSRLQRRGRVGRKSSGTVYYTYEEGAMKENKTQYDISTSDLSEFLLSILKKNDDDIFYNGKPIMPIDYLGNETQYDYQNSEQPIGRFESGYKKDILDDNLAEFYIVHPDELAFNRNILGNPIVSTNEKLLEIEDDKIIESVKMNSFWESLTNRGFLFNGQKTTFGENVIAFSSKLKLTDSRLFLWYIYARILGVGDDVGRLLPFIERMNLSQIISGGYDERGRYKKNLKDAQDRWSDKEGDLASLTNIINGLLKTISNYTDLSPEPGTTQLTQIRESKMAYIEGKKNRTFSYFAGLKIGLLDTFIKMDAKGQLFNSNQIEDDEKDTLLTNNAFTIDTLISIGDIVSTWAPTQYLDVKGLFSYVSNYLKFKGNLYKITEGVEEEDFDRPTKMVDISWFDNNVKIPATHQMGNTAIIQSALIAFGPNLVRVIKGTSSYLLLANPNPNNVYTINPVARGVPIPMTLMKDPKIHHYLLFMQRMFIDQISIVSPVSPKDIQQNVVYLFRPEALKSDIFVPDKYQAILENVVGVPDSALKKEYISNYVDTLDSIKYDLLNNYTDTVWEFMKLDTDELSKVRDEQKNIINSHVQTGGNRDFNINDLITYSKSPIVSNIYKKLNKKRYKLTK